MPRAVTRIGLVAACALCIACAWTHGFRVKSSQGLIDLYPTYVAAALWDSGHAGAVYQTAAFARGLQAHPAWQRKMEELDLVDHGTCFVYSPWYLAMLRPLARVAGLDAFVRIMWLLNLTSVLVIGFESLRRAGLASFALRALGAALMGASFPVVSSVSLGQNTLPTVALVLWGLRLCDLPTRGRYAGCALLLLACCCKPWAAASFALLALTRRYRPFLVCVVGYMLLFLVLPRLVFPAPLVNGYAEMTVRLSRLSLVAFNDLGMRALIHRLTWPQWPTGLYEWSATSVSPIVWNLHVAVTLAAALGFLWLVVRHRLDATVVHAAGLAFCLLPLSVMWGHYLVLTYPLLCLALLAPYARVFTRASALITSLLMFTSLHPPLRGIRPRYTLPDDVATHPYLYAILFALPLMAVLATAAALLRDAARASRRA
ncbi:MAG: glycosyltransferase 87 family protein [Vicinamibacteria bacterium]|nr:glycosyltransferase 87 family protein [Vicinamibacteria bacterium]